MIRTITFRFPSGWHRAANDCRHWWLLCFFALWLAGSPRLRADEAAPRYFGAEPGALAQAKARIAAGDPGLSMALKKLVDGADGALHETPPSVFDKTRIPPSGDRHDYMSLAPYFWPNPKSADGLPYIRRDGRLNPESRDGRMNDGPRMAKMADTIEVLARAYYFTGGERYAAQAAKFARVWFLDPATRMNPNLNFAQAVSGVNEGRSTGILEGRNLAAAADAIGLLADSKSWTTVDQKQLDQWLNTYLDWLLTSAAGQDERAAKNNHGSWYDVQTARLALCLGRTGLARKILEDAGQHRIALQIQTDGRQPLELVRTKSLGYSQFNLEALSVLAVLGEYAGVDLWQFQTRDGRSIARAIQFLIPYLDQPARKWPYEQIKEIDEPSGFFQTLHEASHACHRPEFDAIIAKYPDAGGKPFQLLTLK